MPEQSSSARQTITRESILLVALVVAGLLLLPVAIYLVGQAVFGDYSDGGFADFYWQLLKQLRSGDLLVWYLILSPYLAWQLARLTLWGFRRGLDKT